MKKASEKKYLKKRYLKKQSWLVLCVCLLFFFFWQPFSAFAATGQLAAGTYEVTASLSCHINAMGGVEFGDGLFTGACVTVDEKGEAKVTLGLQASAVTIYSVTCDTFVDAADSEPGYYDTSGTRRQATYTKSKKTALNAGNENVHYVDSMTFPVTPDTSKYYLWIYVNSNVMGCQFGDGSGSGGSGKAGEATPYQAIFTMDWSDVPTAAATSESTNQTSAQAANATANSGTTGSTAANTGSSTTVTAQTESSTAAGAAETGSAQASETMEGLSIYRAEEEITAESANDTALSGQTDGQVREEINEESETQESVTQQQTAAQPIALLYVCIGVCVLFILLGGMFLFSANHTKEHTVVLRFEIDVKGLAELRQELRAAAAERKEQQHSVPMRAETQKQEN